MANLCVTGWGLSKQRKCHMWLTYFTKAALKMILISVCVQFHTLIHREWQVETVQRRPISLCVASLYLQNIASFVHFVHANINMCCYCGSSPQCAGSKWFWPRWIIYMALYSNSVKEAARSLVSRMVSRFSHNGMG